MLRVRWSTCENGFNNRLEFMQESDCLHWLLHGHSARREMKNPRYPLFYRFQEWEKWAKSSIPVSPKGLSCQRLSIKDWNKINFRFLGRSVSRDFPELKSKAKGVEFHLFRFADCVFLSSLSILNFLLAPDTGIGSQRNLSGIRMRGTDMQHPKI